jgi:hypothetical protein
MTISKTEELNKMRDGLGGAAQPGSRASRQLLRNIITDPQQRLAKLSDNNNNSSGGSLLASRNLAFIGNEHTATVEGLREAHRALHGKFIEQQIELETARADRDSLLIELQGAKEALDGSDFKGASLISNSDLSAAVAASTKELSNLRSTIARKEETIDRLLADLAEEKRARAVMEQAAQNRTVEFLSHLETLQR